MKIIICIKQVPDTTEIKYNTENNTIIREGIKSIINPFDLHALEEGVRIKEQMEGVKITLLSMGIPSAVETLKDGISFGADEGILLSDCNFAGADTLATAYTLSMGIKKIGKFDLVLCGKQAVDGDTAQVGPSLADKLGIPHTTNVKKIEEIDERHIRCQRLTEYGYEVIDMKLPALITVVKDINIPRIPTLKGVMKAKKFEICTWNVEDIGADKSCCGLQGSATQVIKTFVPVYNVQREMLCGEPEEQAKKLVDKLMTFNKDTFTNRS